MGNRERAGQSLMQWLLQEAAIERAKLQSQALIETFPGTSQGRALPSSPIAREGGPSIPAVTIRRGGPAGEIIHLSGTSVSLASGGAYLDSDKVESRHGFADTTAGTEVTIPRGGTYGFRLVFDWDSFQGGGTVEVELNGAVIRSASSPDGFGQGAKWADDFKAAKGDTVKVKVTQSSGSAQAATWTLTVNLIEALKGIASSRYEAAVAGDGPSGYWKLDESSGSTAFDSSGGGWDMTYVNAPTLGVTGLMQDGSGATAADFNGTDERAVGSDWAVFDFDNAPFSVECWFNADTVPGSGVFAVLVQKQNDFSGPGWELLLNDGQVKFTGPGNPASAVSADTTYHVVVTVDSSGNAVKLYLNGSEVDSTTYTNPGDSSSNLSFAFDSAAADHHLDGTLDEVAIYDTALTAAEVSNHYTIGSG